MPRNIYSDYAVRPLYIVAPYILLLQKNHLTEVVVQVHGPV